MELTNFLGGKILSREDHEELLALLKRKDQERRESQVTSFRATLESHLGAPLPSELDSALDFALGVAKSPKATIEDRASSWRRLIGAARHALGLRNDQKLRIPYR